MYDRYVFFFEHWVYLFIFYYTFIIVREFHHTDYYLLLLAAPQPIRLLIVSICRKPESSITKTWIQPPSSPVSVLYNRMGKEILKYPLTTSTLPIESYHLGLSTTSPNTYPTQENTILKSNTCVTTQPQPSQPNSIRSQSNSIPPQAETGTANFHHKPHGTSQ